jgi:hypothetical protein
MATTTEHLHKTVYGNKRVSVLSCTIDAASAVIDTGLSVLDFYTVTPVSMTTIGISHRRNLGSGATALPGKLNVNSCVSGDAFLVIAYGR